MQERFETFTVLINRISRNIRRLKNDGMAKYGLRSSHISCIYFLYNNTSLTSSELCELCEEDKATVSRAVEFLEEKGLVSSAPKGAKRYKTPVSLTETGRVLGKEISHKISQVLDAVSVGLSEEERKAFYRSLYIISKNLDGINVG